MSRRLHWRRHCPGDHLAHAADLTLEEDGALLRLRDWYWMNGPIPADVDLATKLIRAPRAKSAMVNKLLARFFLLRDEGYVSLELDDERSHAERVVEQRKTAGRSGGMAKAKAIVSANAKQTPSDHITSDHIRGEEYAVGGGTSLASGYTPARGDRDSGGVR